MAYFYLVSSLPLLKLGEEPPVSSEEFFRSCDGVLSESDYADMRCILEGRLDDATSDFVQKWRDMDTQLRNMLARERAADRKLDPSPYIKSHNGYEIVMDQAAEQAMSMDNPLDRELFLDRTRWHQLDELALDDDFGAGAVFAFALKLKIVERWAAMDTDTGNLRVEKILEHYMETVEI